MLANAKSPTSPFSPAQTNSQNKDPRLKDQVLFELGADFNTAQFVSFAADATFRFSRLAGLSPNHSFDTLETAIAALFERAEAVSVRTFLPNNPQTTDFAFDLRDPKTVLETSRAFMGRGLFIILNEAIPAFDGGIAGVIQGKLVEFACLDTPRCVEKPGTLAVTRDFADQLLSRVYCLALPAFEPGLRVEFTLHPLPQGTRQEHVVVWEASREAAPREGDLLPVWPNRFSTMLGDKLFGLLVADILGLPVPKTTALTRRIAPFTFGRETGSAETWLRTCPSEQTPGLFTTTRGWTDPFALLGREDPEGTKIAAVIAQAGVRAHWSGACVTGADGSVFVEGLSGLGEDFMLGEAVAAELPIAIEAEVREHQAQIAGLIGPNRFEWVHDGEVLWIVQLHRGRTATTAKAIVAGEAEVWHAFDPAEGLEALRDFLDRLKGLEDGRRHGIALTSSMGRTSHKADLLRKAGLPARFATAGSAMKKT